MKKGFTLIELLAVIVILAIIALIATPIILGIINDAREESNERSVELYASAIRNGIAAYQLREGKEVLPGTYNETNKLPFEVEYDGKVDCTSVIIGEDGKVSLDKCTVNGGTKEYSLGVQQEVTKACTLDDKDSDGKASLSDVVTCGTENFYVMYNKNNEITMLSMYNLYVGNKIYVIDANKMEYEVEPLENPTNKQSEIAKGGIEGELTWYGTVTFSNEEYWEDSGYVYVYDHNSNLYPYIIEYERILKEDLGVSSADATLISYEQLLDLCDSDQCNEAEWLYSTTYWGGNASSERVLVMSRNSPYINDMEYFNASVGVRPVITISTSDIQ